MRTTPEDRLKKRYTGILLPHKAEGPPSISWRETLVLVAVPQWGKTTLMQAIAQPLKGNIIVVDTAQRGEWDNWGVPVTEDWHDLARLPGVVWRPNIDHVLDWDRHGLSDDWSQGLRLIMEQRAPRRGEGGADDTGVTLLLDEMLDSAPTRLHPTMRRAAVTGEGRGLGLWGGTQSPYGVSQRVLSAAKHRFVGRVGTAVEKGILEANWGTLPQGEPEPYTWTWLGTRGEVWGPLILAGGQLSTADTKKDMPRSEPDEGDPGESRTEPLEGLTTPEPAP